MIDSINFDNWTKEQQQTMTYYLSNEMRNLKKICNPLIRQKGVAGMYYDDLYAVASDTLLESIESYDGSKKCSFKTYLSGNIGRAYYDWTRDQRRFKRCNLMEEKDNDGNTVTDKYGRKQYIVISDIPFDEPTEDGIDLLEKIPSSFKLEECLSKEIGLSSDDKWERYLGRLSVRQRKVAIFLSEGYKAVEIREILDITEKDYTDDMIAIKSHENISILI